MNPCNSFIFRREIMLKNDPFKIARNIGAKKSLSRPS